MTTSPRSLAAVLVTLTLAGAASGARPTGAVDEANRAYVEHRYGDAIRGFESAAQRDGGSAPLYYNLGNAYQKEGRIGRAILSYERALWLTPRDPDIAANLNVARTTVNLPAPHHPWYRIPARLLSPLEWSWLAASALVLVCLALGIAAWKPLGRRALYVLAIGAVIAGVTSTLAIAVDGRGIDDAVVTATGGTPLLLSPFDGARVEARATEGEHVVLLGRHGNFVRVRDDDGHMGWATASAVEPVIL